MKTTTLPLRNSINHSSARLAFSQIPLALTFAWFALAPAARAVCQDGCDTTNQNTFLGEDALLNNRNGNNTAIGFQALSSNTTGFNNTATGDIALDSNTTGSANTANGSTAPLSNTTANNNTATGFQALEFNTTGF